MGWFEKHNHTNDLDDGLLGYESAPFDNFTFKGVTYNMGDQIPIYDKGTGVAYGTDNKNMMADYNFIWDAKMGNAGSNSMLLGLEYLYQEGGKWGRYGDLEGDFYNYSFYVNDQLLLLGDALVLSAGLRRDEHEVYGAKTTGKIGSAYTFFSMGTTLFANYGTSFRAPSIFNLYSVYGNEDLKPEEGWTVEGGVRQVFMGGRIDVEVTYWYSELDDVIAFDYTIPNPAAPRGYGKYANRDSGETSGVEVAFGSRLTDHLKLDGNYTYTHAYTEKDGERFRTVQIARNKGSLTLSYEADKYYVGITGHYTGPRLRWRGDIDYDDGYTRFDLAGRYNLWKGLSVYTRVNNIFDVEYNEDPFEMPGFYAIVGVTYTHDFMK